MEEGRSLARARALEGKDISDFETWMNVDMRYIGNRSLTLDSKMLLTIPHAPTGRGAH